MYTYDLNLRGAIEEKGSGVVLLQERRTDSTRNTMYGRGRAGEATEGEKKCDSEWSRNDNKQGRKK